MIFNRNQSNVTTFDGIKWPADPLLGWATTFNRELKMTPIFKKTIPLVASLLLLAGSPAFAAIHDYRTEARDERLPARVYEHNAPVQANVCMSPPVINKYDQSTATPPGCPGASGPYN
jgi:hypothetical protein